MRLAETCGCGAQFSVEDTFHSAAFVYAKLDEWRTWHPCVLRQETSKPTAPPVDPSYRFDKRGWLLRRET